MSGAQTAGAGAPAVVGNQPSDPSAQPGGAMPPAGSPAGSDDEQWPGLDPLEAAREQALGRFENTKEALRQLSAMNTALTKLIGKGDALRTEDVIDAAGGLTSKGWEPKALATVLADMPTGGEALQQWVKTYDAMVEENLGKVKAAHEINRQNLAVASLHSLTAMDIGHIVRTVRGARAALAAGGGASPAMPASPGNQLGAPVVPTPDATAGIAAPAGNPNPV